MLNRKFVPHWATFGLLAASVVVALLTLTFVGSSSATAKGDGRPMTMTVEDAHLTFLGGAPNNYFIVIGNITEVDGETVTGKYYCRGVFTDPGAVGLPPLIDGTPLSGGLTFVEQRFRIDGQGTIIGAGDEGHAPLAILGGTGRFTGVHGSYTPSGFPIPLGAGELAFEFRLRRGG